MTNLTRDPKGYYVALGIAEDADADAIKAAFRNKAKRLHPDFNPSPVAAKQFHRLHEAYETLKDPEKRAAYDHPWRTAQEPKARETREPPKRKAKPPPKQKRPEPAADRPTPPSNGGLEEPVVCQCGKITAQPRYVVFDLVWGRLKKIQKSTIDGVFCRTCADRAALKASFITWLAGWWAWPNGPKETVKALLNNIRGGRKPADRNAHLLMRQARAFRARGEMELARSAAEQALAFAGPGLRSEINAFLQPLSGYSRSIKDRWAKPGWAPMLQVLPLAIIVAALSTLLTFSTPAPLTTLVTDFFARVTAPAPPTPLPDITVVERVYSVTREGAALRTGPGESYQLAAVLKSGALVLAKEVAPDGIWLRVETSDGSPGFISMQDLTADVKPDALDDIGTFGTTKDAAAEDGKASPAKPTTN